MTFLRRIRLNRVLVCVCGLAAQFSILPVSLRAQQNNNPFENIPQTGPAQPAAPRPGTPAPVAPPTPAPGQPPIAAPQFENPILPAPAPAAVGEPVASNVIEDIEFRGSRKIPQDTLRSMIFSRRGDEVNAETLRRDFMVLWNTNRFDDIKLERENGERGGTVIRFIVTERPVVRDIKYEGLKSASISDILDRFRERKVGLVQDAPYDPAIINRAAVSVKELLAERGHQFATVTPDLRRIPPSSMEVIFNIDEGPKVKVGKITIEGNQAMSDRAVITAMKNLKPVGIPHSLVLENLFARTYDASKLDEDKDRIRDAYGQKGYYTAKVLNEKLQMRTTGGIHGQIHIPLFKENRIGQAQDITLPVEEGRRYSLGTLDFTGIKQFRSTEFLAQQFGMKPGDIFSTEKLRTGLKNMTKVYAEFGFIDYVGDPDISPVPNSDKINMTLNVEEGPQFFVRRIDFAGNTTTRDKVIRRELLIDEGDLYSSYLWDQSILRLNQLGYFETLKENESYELKRNAGTNTLDITLKVKERGKNSISLNGGVSGLSGTFVGLNYSTNNFLGLGETLSLGAQVGTLTDNINLGFTEPYLFDHPIQAGVNFYLQRYDYNQGRQTSILSGTDVTQFFNALGDANVLNYVQNSRGFSVSLSYAIRRSFGRIGLTYGYDDSSIDTKSIGANTYFTYLSFQGVSGPNSLNGIKTSKIVPSYSYNSRNNYQNPTAGKSIFASIEFAGSVLGGNVNTIRPTLDIQYYHPSPKWRRNTLAFHLMGSTIFGYGGKVAPPFARTFIGGENDVRGFDFFSITPVAYIPSSVATNVLNSDGTQRTQTTLINGALTRVAVQQNIPIYQVTTPGGDTQSVFNFEYRIPIFGPVMLSPFFDAGMNRILFTNQLKVNGGQIDSLNNTYRSAAFTDKVKIAAGTQRIRTSTGVEISVILPIVQAPFRVYWALNPTTVNTAIRSPIVLDPTTLPNAATLLNAVNSYSPVYPLDEKRSVFRFTIGRTF